MVVKFQVFKKCCPNGKLTIYLTKRDFIEKENGVDPVEGVVLIDPSYVGERNVYVVLVLNFRFGREEDESMGYNFVKTVTLNTTVVYPPEREIEPSEVQRNLCSKLGNFAFPFALNFPSLVTPSYQLQKGWDDSGAIMGLEYEAMAFIGVNDHDIQDRSSARLMIRKLQEVPRSVFESEAPKAVITKSFLTCSGNLRIEAALEKPVYFPEENINVSVNIKNDTTREAKRVKVKVVQLSTVPMFSSRQVRDKTLMKLDEACPMPPGSSINRKFTVMAGVPPAQSNGQVFLQGNLRPTDHEELACSTILNDVDKDDLFGVYVTYAVRIKVTMGPLTGDVVLDIPFTFTIPEVQALQEPEVTPTETPSQLQTPEIQLRPARPARPARQHMYHHHQYQQHRQQQYNLQQQQQQKRAQLKQQIEQMQPSQQAQLTQQQQQQQEQFYQQQLQQQRQQQLRQMAPPRSARATPSPTPNIAPPSPFGSSQLITPMQ